jgi:uncharacterized protein YdeI (YjbR/CyaY-like superfamily)
VATPRYFSSPAQLRQWFERHHADADELLVGYHKRGTGRASVTWAESVDEALCVGWIDGIRRSVDQERYTIRFTPRRARSIWSKKNLARMEELIAEGRVQPTGLRAFESRDRERTNQYSFEQEDAAFDADQERAFRANKKAWRFFSQQPPSYRKPAIWWVVSAKRADTKARRLATLIDDSAHGRRIKQLQRPTPTRRQ